MCRPTDLGCHITSGFGAAATNALQGVAESIGKGATEGINAVATFFFEKPSPTLATESGQAWQSSDSVKFLQDNVLWVSAVVFTVAMLIAAIRMAWEQRAKPLQELLKAMMIFVAVGAAGTATLQLLAEWSDDFAKEMVRQVAPGEQAFSAGLGSLVMQGSLSMATGNPAPSLIMMFAGVVVIFAALIQVVLMVVRSAMLILLAGTFPLAAAATNTEVGQTWFKKYCGWALAFIAYKPAAALIYAAAMKMNEKGVITSKNSFVQTTTGLMMLLLAIFALPALLRFMVPVTAAVAGGSAGMGSSVADPGGLATGALNIGRSALGRGAGGGGASGSGAGGGATGAVAAGPASIGIVAAGAALNGGRKLAGGVAGAAAHSAGEAGGGSVTPTSSFGPISRGGSKSGARSSSYSSGSVASGGGPAGSSPASGRSPGGRPMGGPASPVPERIPEPAGPSGSR
ncbi:hypothetical protein EV646_10788 [Kribbella antiqua]|uniref:TrbL/VirB6 plasmid conjugal transfer protein n=1 Tax=Kribbella antiqua TaxID=2512217 RepID=A0A4R2IMN9_9ACTN|nr:hypothetical protein [Kribbella antiqua]TCO46067.1 hypothetical protein EV646_10788 [Kribbella antiqua]